MVTRNELLRQSAEQAAEEEAAKERREQEHEDFMKRYAAEHKKRAAGMVDGELGEFLKWANSQGLRTVFLSQYKCWKPGTTSSRDEIYGTKFQLDFEPFRKFPATKVLLKSLKKAGFKAEVVSEWHGNVEYVTCGDDYDVVDAPGTHEECYIKISW
jgi:phosphoglycolate phosphatase-like HAD superfamily hydrolase